MEPTAHVFCFGAVVILVSRDFLILFLSPLALSSKQLSNRDYVYSQNKGLQRFVALHKTPIVAFV